MSSFLGHSLAAYTLFSLERWKRPFSRGRAVWLGWLVALASAPDIDYLVPALASPAHEGRRVTHSIAFSLLLPLSSVVALYFVKGLESRRRRLLSVCAVLAGLSHLLLDCLVGVTPLPLLWPLDSATYSSPVGVLPSAGRIQLSNYYLYRNVLIEAGVLAPLCYVARGLYLGAGVGRNRARTLILLLVAGCFVAWSVSLSR
ncbi:MAG TPA: metal-dependent hydrolase [Pyrinomonadaceae bacterium]|nr:metal-dependent hydrolase [Pyrinomonadaceae bacterium]